MIDLHTHTTNSDGSQTTIELLKEAQEKGIKYLSITDHDNIDSYYDIKDFNLKDYYTGELINGVEISTLYNGELIEVLAYFFDLEKMGSNMAKNHIYTNLKEKFKKRFDIIKEEYAKRGITLKYDVDDENGDTSNEILHPEIIKYVENDKFFLDIKNKEKTAWFVRNELYNPKSQFYIDQTAIYPNLEAVIELVHDSNGLAFLAHPFVYSKNIVEQLENILNSYPFDGIECFYTTFTEDQTKYLLDMASKYNLFVSGGSDYHGTVKQNHFLGEFCSDNKTVYEHFLQWSRI